MLNDQTPTTDGLTPEPTIVVSVSGGKDSTATALVAISRHPRQHIRLVHFETGNEHELTETYVRETLPAALGLPVEILKADFSNDIARKRRYIESNWPEKGVPPDRIRRALELLHPTGNPMLDLCMWKGRFPSRKAQFCTSELKRFMSDAYMMKLMEHGAPLESWQGVRRDESQARKDALEVERAAEGWLIRRPIVDWTAQEVVDFVRASGVPLNPLYSLGCSRVGCMPCINASKSEIANIARRWPHHIARIAEWERLVSECSKRGETTFFADSFNEGETTDQIFERLRIENHVKWAMTSRGGKQSNLLQLLPSPSCSSSYGLCE